jgi:hypothetical protein
MGSEHLTDYRDTAIAQLVVRGFKVVHTDTLGTGNRNTGLYVWSHGAREVVGRAGADLPGLGTVLALSRRRPYGEAWRSQKRRNTSGSSTRLRPSRSTNPRSTSDSKARSAVA